VLTPRETRPEPAAPLPEGAVLGLCYLARPHFAPIDSNGNLSQKVEGGTTWTYVWDAENRLKWVCNTTPCTQGGAVASFLYDALGRRVEKVAGGVTTTYSYDGEAILRQIAGSSTLNFVHGPRIDEPLAQEDAGGALAYFHADGLGSIVKTTSSAGAVTSTRRYDGFGNFELGAANGYAFTGREWDTETGMAYYRARYYDPKVGRFISEDPIGLEGGDINLYAYVLNTPTTFTDPLGLRIGWLSRMTPRFLRSMRPYPPPQRPPAPRPPAPAPNPANQQWLDNAWKGMERPPWWRDHSAEDPTAGTLDKVSEPFKDLGKPPDPFGGITICPAPEPQPADDWYDWCVANPGWCA
jgi:RHS repeat-associated protein